MNNARKNSSFIHFQEPEKFPFFTYFNWGDNPGYGLFGERGPPHYFLKEGPFFESDLGWGKNFPKFFFYTGGFHPFWSGLVIERPILKKGWYHLVPRVKNFGLLGGGGINTLGKRVLGGLRDWGRFCPGLKIYIIRGKVF